MDLETRRQLIHMSGIIIPFYLIWSFQSYGYNFSLLSFVTVLILLYAITIAYKREFGLFIISRIIDCTERSNVINISPVKGARMFFIGSIISLILFNSNIEIVAASIAILALGDSFSTLFGIRFGNHKLPYNQKKSFEGSFIGFIAASCGAFFFVPYPIAIGGAFGGMLIESLPLNIDDNLIISLSASYSMILLYLVF